MISKPTMIVILNICRPKKQKNTCKRTSPVIGFVALPFIVLLVLWQAEAYLLFTGLLAGILFGIGLFVSAGFDIADRNDQIHYTVIEASQCAGQPAVEVRNDTSEWVIT